MNILQILPRLDLGGVEQGVVDFSKFLVENGHKAVVISSGGRRVKELISWGVRHYTLDVHRKSLFSAISCIREVKRIIEQEQIEIVHCRSRVPDWIGYFASLKTSARFLVTVHGYYSVHFFSRIVSLGRAVISPSNTIAWHLRENFSVPKEKIVVVERGIDIERFKFVSPQEKDFSVFKIIFAGRISPIKGIEYFIEAVNKLVPELPHLKAYIVGEAHPKHLNYKHFLQRKVRKYGLSDCIEFKPPQDSAFILKDMHVLVLPSLIPESFGRVILEAQARGVACIATNLGGPSEIIEDGQNGFLVPPFDAEAMKTKILKLSRSRDLYSDIVYKARRNVEEKYTLFNMINKTLAIYRKVLNSLNIVIIKISSLGDVVLATATIKTLKKHFSSSCISILCSRRFFKIIEDLEEVDEIIIYEEERSSKLRELLRLSSLLRKKNIDILIDLQNNYFSHFLSFLSLPKKSIGFNRKFGFFLDIKVPYLQRLNPLDSQLKLLEILGINRIEAPELFVNPRILKRIEEALRASGIKNKDKVVGINIEASSSWKTKNILPEFLERIVEYIRKKGAKIILTGTQASWLKAQKIAENFGGVYNFCGRTDLKELLALIKRCDLFISPDSAPLHIAYILGVKTVGVFGPTSSSRHTLEGKSLFIYTKNLNCSGCYRKKCRRLDCMKITPEELSVYIEACL